MQSKLSIESEGLVRSLVHMQYKWDIKLESLVSSLVLL